MMCALVIGTGSIGKRHINNIKILYPDTHFILLRKDARRDDLSYSLGADVIGNIHDGIKMRPEYAVVATPSSLHIDALLPLVEANLPFYIEKPMVSNFRDMELLRAAMESQGFSAPNLVGCNLRFLPSLLKMYDLIKAGVLGNIVRATLQAGQWLPDWRPAHDYRLSYSAKAELGGGVVMDLIHELDVVRWLLGDFDIVYSLLGKFSSLEITSEDSACILLGKKGGAPIVSVNLDYVSRKPIRCYEVVGDEATLRWDLPAKTLELIGPSSTKLVDCGIEGFNVGNTYTAAMREFIGAVKTGGRTSQDIWDGLKSVELAIKAKGSL